IAPADTPVTMGNSRPGARAATAASTPTSYAARAPPPASTSARGKAFTGSPPPDPRSYCGVSRGCLLRSEDSFCSRRPSCPALTAPLALAGMHIRRGVGFVLRLARPAAHDAQHVDDIIVRRVELGLCKVRQQAVVAAVTVHDDDFLTAIPRHLVGRFLQQLELESPAVRDGAWLMLRFEDLTKVVLGKDDRVFLLGGVERGIAHVEQIVAQRQMRPVLLENAEGEQAGALGTRDGVLEVGGRQLFPMDRRLVLWGRGLRPHGRD